MVGDEGVLEGLDPCNVFVKFLPPDVDDAGLRSMFQKFGEIESCKVMIDRRTCSSLGYGFVRFYEADKADAALKAMHGKRLGSKTLLCKLSNVMPSVSKDAIEPSNNLYVEPLPADMDEAGLRVLFEKYGTVEQCKVMVDKLTGQSRQIGFVRFDALESAANAIKGMNGYTPENGLPLAVKYSETESQRLARKKRNKKNSLLKQASHSLNNQRQFRAHHPSFPPQNPLAGPSSQYTQQHALQKANSHPQTSPLRVPDHQPNSHVGSPIMPGSPLPGSPAQMVIMHSHPFYSHPHYAPSSNPHSPNTGSPYDSPYDSPSLGPVNPAGPAGYYDASLFYPSEYPVDFLHQQHQQQHLPSDYMLDFDSGSHVHDSLAAAAAAAAAAANEAVNSPALSGDGGLADLASLNMPPHAQMPIYSSPQSSPLLNSGFVVELSNVPGTAEQEDLMDLLAPFSKHLTIHPPGLVPQEYGYQVAYISFPTQACATDCCQGLDGSLFLGEHIRAVQLPSMAIPSSFLQQHQHQQQHQQQPQQHQQQPQQQPLQEHQHQHQQAQKNID